jgi:hypothetical protein
MATSAGRTVQPSRLGHGLGRGCDVHFHGAAGRARGMGHFIEDGGTDYDAPFFAASSGLVVPTALDTWLADAGEELVDMVRGPVDRQPRLALDALPDPFWQFTGGGAAAHSPSRWSSHDCARRCGHSLCVCFRGRVHSLCLKDLWSQFVCLFPWTCPQFVFKGLVVHSLCVCFRGRVHSFVFKANKSLRHRFPRKQARARKPPTANSNDVSYVRQESVEWGGPFTPQGSTACCKASSG